MAMCHASLESPRPRRSFRAPANLYRDNIHAVGDADRNPSARPRLPAVGSVSRRATSVDLSLSCLLVMAHIVMAYIVVAHIVMAYLVMAHIVMAHIVVACTCITWYMNMADCQCRRLASELSSMRARPARARFYFRTAFRPTPTANAEGARAAGSEGRFYFWTVLFLDSSIFGCVVLKKTRSAAHSGTTGGAVRRCRSDSGRRPWRVSGMLVVAY